MSLDSSMSFNEGDGQLTMTGGGKNITMNAKPERLQLDTNHWEHVKNGK